MLSPLCPATWGLSRAPQTYRWLNFPHVTRRSDPILIVPQMGCGKMGDFGHNCGSYFPELARKADPLCWDHLSHVRHCSKHFNCHNPLVHEAATNIPISCMEKQRHRKVEQVALCHTARKWQGWDGNPGSQTPEGPTPNDPATPPGQVRLLESVFSSVRGLPVILAHREQMRCCV